MSILLTDEEMQDAVGRVMADKGLSQIAKECITRDSIIAKAQLKKVVEWGSEPCYEHLSVMGGLPVRRARCEICWQKLLKECNE